MQINTFGINLAQPNRRVPKKLQNSSLVRQQCNKLPHCNINKNLLNLSFEGKTLHGAKTAIDLPDLKENLSKLYCKIKKTDNEEEKIRLFESSSEIVAGFLADWHSQNFNYLNKAEDEMFCDFRHELFNDYNYPYTKYIFNCSTNNEEKNVSINQMSKSTFQDLVKTTKRYKFFIEHGLSSCTKNLPEMMQLVLKPEKASLERRGINLKIKGKRLLKKENIKFKLTDYETYIILRNITHNASKYTKDGSEIKIKFSLDKKNSLLNVSVEDEGIGIKKEDINKVIEGERADNAIKSGLPGTGRGLKRVVKILEEKANQKINIESPINPRNEDFPGTRISFSIPVEIKD